MSTEDRALTVLALMRALNTEQAAEVELIVSDDPTVLVDGVRYAVSLLRLMLGSQEAVTAYLQAQTANLVQRLTETP